ncbi:MAG: ABC transporter ATP-binding protein, partial [Bacteroidales bacterium]
GERQRISIARALLIDPEVYIFDEATSALDNESEAIIQSAINETLQEKTAIIVAHRLTTIQNADQILFIEEGNVSESGTHQELLELKGKYYQYYAHQNLFHS